MALIDKNRKMLPMYVEESVYREIKVYAAETDKTMYEVLTSISQEFEQSCLKLVAQIKEMKRQAELVRLKQEEESRIVSENPLLVEGHEVDPIGKLEVESPITN